LFFLFCIGFSPLYSTHDPAIWSSGIIRRSIIYESFLAAVPMQAAGTSSIEEWQQ
jgi:hypothetical protein